MWPELGREWELSREEYEQFDRREGAGCARCGSNLRARQLAVALTEHLNALLNSNHSSLSALCEEAAAQKLMVAEINAAGALHQFLQKLKGLHYSEYGGRPSGARSEDLMALSYGDETFDLVVTSETLEHVPDVGRALSEIRRVLKQGGQHIFTIPIVWDRKSRIRAELVEGKVIWRLPPSYHGTPGEGQNDFLVFHEFGGDVVKLIERVGFEVEVVKDPRNPALSTLVTRRKEL